MTENTTIGKNKIKYVLIAWISFRILDVIFRHTIATNVETRHIVYNSSGVVLLFILYYFLLKGNNVVRKIYIGIVSFAIVGVLVYFLIIMFFPIDLVAIIKMSTQELLEPYKYFTLPIIYGCIVLCYCFLLFDNSVKQHFSNKS